jgi:DNA-binding CsgD family transcriptional regulator
VADKVSGPVAEQALALVRAIVGDPGDGARFTVSDRVLRLLHRVAQERPLLCCVDDTHWLDRQSFDTFGFVARRLHQERIAMLLTRCDETGPAEPVPGVPAHRLGPLDHRAGREMLQDLVPIADAADALACVAMGNPYALTDLARSLTPEQIRGDAPLPQTLPAESALRRSYRTQLQRLPTDARWLVLLAAADEELDVDTLVRAAAASSLDISALAPAELAGLVRVEGTAIRFTRPLVRAVAYHEATLAERRSVHTLLAETLDPETQPLRHYLHRAFACSGPDDLLAAQLERAAAGSRGRHAAASRALERAAELTHDSAAVAARLVASARHAWRAGEPYRARMLLRGVRLMAVSAGVHAESQVLQGEIELRVGVTTVARDTLLGAAEELATSDRYRAIDAFMRAGEAMCLSGDYAHYPDIARQALALRRPDEPPAVEFVCEHFTALSATFRGEHRRAAVPLRRVLALAPVLDDAGALTQASYAAMLCGAEAEAYRLANRGAAVAQANRDVSTGPRALDLAALAEFAMGRYDNPATALRGLELARSSGQENLVGGQLATLALLAATMGDRATCLRRVRAVKTHLTPHSAGRARAITDWALALLDLSDGHYADAVARLTAIMVNPGGGHLIVQLAATPHLVEAAVRCDARRPAAAALKVFDAWASNSANPRWLALSARCHALLAGRGGEADEYFHEALGQHQLSTAEFDRARTELLFGQKLRRQRRRAAAREQLRSALDTFERFEARPWIDQATAELRAAGHQVQPRRVLSADSLTPQQEEIARLVADGATNREIATQLLLSTRTIDHHLRNIFAKLGVRSRVDLARLIS